MRDYDLKDKAPIDEPEQEWAPTEREVRIRMLKLVADDKYDVKLDAKKQPWKFFKSEMAENYRAAALKQLHDEHSGVVAAVEDSLGLDEA